MKILLTGVTGYIGKRLLPILVENGHEIVCCVRDKRRFTPSSSILDHIQVVEIDLLNFESLSVIPKDIDAAYYLVHSMTNSSNYEELEKQSAQNFRQAISETKAKQVIYLGGIINDDNLSKHLQSRKDVEIELSKGSYHLTSLRAGIIVGSGSASFEIMRDLVEKLPIMITPKWLQTKCQPIGISDVIKILEKTVNCEATFDKNFDIGCNDILTYKEMLLEFARIRNLKRKIWTVPVMTPRLSSYWLYFVTATSYKLAKSLVDSMKVEVVCRNNDIHEILEIKPISYTQALEKAFEKIENNEILSSWKDSYSSSDLQINISDFINVPKHGCYKDERHRDIKNKEKAIEKIWGIGGENGWYYANWLWSIRGFLDKLSGGVGLRRGRTSKDSISAGDSLDFWRVIYANKDEGRLLLFAEMKLPGEAWLEFKITNDKLTQTATFRPLGLLGRLYWFLVLPFHGFIFKGLINEIVKFNSIESR